MDKSHKRIRTEATPPSPPMTDHLNLQQINIAELSKHDILNLGYIAYDDHKALPAHVHKSLLDDFRKKMLEYQTHDDSDTITNATNIKDMAHIYAAHHTSIDINRDADLVAKLSTDLMIEPQLKGSWLAYAFKNPDWSISIRDLATNQSATIFGARYKPRLLLTSSSLCLATITRFTAIKLKHINVNLLDVDTLMSRQYYRVGQGEEIMAVAGCKTSAAIMVWRGSESAYIVLFPNTSDLKNVITFLPDAARTLVRPSQPSALMPANNFTVMGLLLDDTSGTMRLWVFGAHFSGRLGHMLEIRCYIEDHLCGSWSLAYAPAISTDVPWSTRPEISASPTGLKHTWCLRIRWHTKEHNLLVTLQDEVYVRVIRANNLGFWKNCYFQADENGLQVHSRKHDLGTGIAQSQIAVNDSFLVCSRSTAMRRRELSYESEVAVYSFQKSADQVHWQEFMEQLKNAARPPGQPARLLR